MIFRIILILVVLSNSFKFSYNKIFFGNRIEGFIPCENGFLYMERIIGGPPNKENYWDGYMTFDIYPNLTEAKVTLTLDAPANLVMSEDEGRVTTLSDGFHITFFKKDGNFTFAEFRVIGVSKGKFPNIKYLDMNGVDACPNPIIWNPTIIGPQSQGSLIFSSDMNSSQESLITNTSQNCGRRQILHQDLNLNGFPSNEGDWPWHAAIYHRNNSTSKNYKCGGTFITKDTVLTAAHCIVENKRFVISNRILVRLGQHNRSVCGRYTQEFEVFRTIPHSEFGFDDLKNDIALLKLATEPTLSPYIQPACLWPSNNISLENVINKSGVVIGWGFSSENKLSDILTQTQMPIVSFIDCLKSNRDFFGTFLSDKNYCAGSRNGTNVCNGDSGGGMFLKTGNQYFIRGLVSLTISKGNEEICDSKQYVIFTDVAKYLDWININLL